MSLANQESRQCVAVRHCSPLRLRHRNATDFASHVHRGRAAVFSAHTAIRFDRQTPRPVRGLRCAVTMREKGLNDCLSRRIPSRQTARRWSCESSKSLRVLVGAEGFEPPAPCSQSRCSTRLSYAPTQAARCLACGRLIAAPCDIFQAVGLGHSRSARQQRLFRARSCAGLDPGVLSPA